jgi:uncharacterized membrane protein required for colicin V production
VRELINLIPFLDIIIGALLLFFMYMGWRHGVPKLLMVIGAVYTGFLLASIYYHLFGVALANMFKIKSAFVADLVSFLVLDTLITILMLVLLLNIFRHIEVKGRAVVFDKIAGSVVGLFAAVLVVGILITLLRVPYEVSKNKLNPATDVPAVQVFNNAYERSGLAPNFLKAAPLFIRTVTPLLPAGTKEKGAVPLLQSIVASQRQ